MPAQIPSKGHTPSIASWNPTRHINYHPLTLRASRSRPWLGPTAGIPRIPWIFSSSASLGDPGPRAFYDCRSRCTACRSVGFREACNKIQLLVLVSLLVPIYLRKLLWGYRISQLSQINRVETELSKVPYHLLLNYILIRLNWISGFSYKLQCRVVMHEMHCLWAQCVIIVLLWDANPRSCNGSLFRAG